jgi:hypothetical protein
MLFYRPLAKSRTGKFDFGAIEGSYGWIWFLGGRTRQQLWRGEISEAAKISEALANA